MTAQSRILIIDYGSQYTQLIARRVREARVYSEIHPPTRSLQWIRDWKPTGIILSGGPNSVYGENVPTADPALFDVAPTLGVCYGMQLMAHVLGGTDRGHVRHHCPHHVVPAGEPGEDAIQAGVDVGLVRYYEDQQRMTVMGCHPVELGCDVARSGTCRAVVMEPVQHVLDVRLTAP